MNKFQMLIIISSQLISSCTNTPHEQRIKADLKELYRDLEFEMPGISPPEFPDLSIDITDYRAVGDGQTVNTEAFAKAINELSEKGGGTLLIPEGIWLTGPIVLKSNINIHTENGALVLFTKNYDDYPLVKTSFEGLETVRCQSPISARGVKNIAFTGEGVFDGSGEYWQAVHKRQLSPDQWNEKISSGRGIVDTQTETWYPSESYRTALKMSELNVVKKFKTFEEFETIKEFLRPVMVSLVNCENVLLDGPTFQNSPAWCIHPLMSKNIFVRNVTVRNPWYSQNGDGIDIESCENVLLYNCRFDVGDDAICVKSGKDEDGRKRGIPTKNLVVKNCIVYHGHGGIVIGSEMSGGVENLHTSNCLFMGTDAGIRFKSIRGRGGVVKNIFISNIKMTDIPAYAITFNMYYQGKSTIELVKEDRSLHETIEDIPGVTEETPQFKDIFISDIECNYALQAIYFQGLPEMKLKNVELRNINIKADYGMVCVDADNIKLTNVKLVTTHLPVMRYQNSSNIEIDGFAHTHQQKSEIIRIAGSESGNISIENSNISIESISVADEIEMEQINIQY